MTPQDKIKAAVGICGPEAVHKSFTDYLRTMAAEEYANDFEIQADGSIWGLFSTVSEFELSEFVDFCEKENV